MKIGILGVGGVGGFFGGKLAQYYRDSADVNIIFIARPATADVLRRNGLRLITPDGEHTIRPVQVATTAAEAGPLDVLLCCTKSYDLAEALRPLKDSITANTLFLPLLNGVDAKDIILSVYPDATVLDGCVYVNARKIAPAVIQKTGPIEKLYFGSETLPRERLETLQQIFTGAGIDSHLSAQIKTDIWTKFVFMAGMATTTSYYDEPIGAVLQHPEHRATIQSLLTEAHAVAVANGILLPADIVDQTIRKMEQFPFESTSSMHRDFQTGGRTEYASLTKYIADLGDKLDVDTPTFDRMVTGFAARG